MPNGSGILPGNRKMHTPERLLGAYYTPHSAADFLAEWILRRNRERILEPSFGNGIFVRAVDGAAQRRSFRDIKISGFDIDERATAIATQHYYQGSVELRVRDFLSVEPFEVQAVIGNPPYVRLRHLDEPQRKQALAVSQWALRERMDPSGSLWMPFLLHAMRFLAPGGRLALVLPYEFTYVRYGFPLWKLLSESFGSLQLLRSRQRLFPDLLQEVVLLLADGYGAGCNSVRYQAFDCLSDLFEGRPTVDDALEIEKLLNGERVFLSALLDRRVRELLSTVVPKVTVPSSNLVKFRIGYVTGNKTFFHPTTEVVRKFCIPGESLRQAIVSARAIRGGGLCTSSLSEHARGSLFLPNPKQLTTGERDYIEEGIKSGVCARYKCKIREPWFIVPGVERPDVVLSVFSSRPILLVNDIDCFASNSFLCGFCYGTTPKQYAATWYTSLTLLQCEMHIHALGGGVMVMVPREAGRICVPPHIQITDDYLAVIDRHLRAGDVSNAYRTGDVNILGPLGFGREDLEQLRHGIDVLVRWRTAVNGGSVKPPFESQLSDDVPEEQA